MTTRFRWIRATGLPALSLTIVAEALAAGEPPIGAQPLPLDVHGIALGMTPGQAQAALAQAGLPAVESRSGVPKDAGFAIGRIRPNKHDDLTFVSTMVSRSPIYRRDPRSDHLVAVTFTPERGSERVWGVGMRQTYAPGEMPSVINTLSALASKYGDTAWATDMSKASFLPGVRRDQRTFNAALLWYWNDAGEKGPRTIFETCRQGLHNTYFLNQVGHLSMTTVNTAFEKPSWFGGPVAAGCSKVIRSQLQWNEDGAVTSLSVEIVDLAAAGAAGMRLATEIGRRDGQASANRAGQAAEIKPKF